MHLCVAEHTHGAKRSSERFFLDWTGMRPADRGPTAHRSGFRGTQTGAEVGSHPAGAPPLLETFLKQEITCPLTPLAEAVNTVISNSRSPLPA